MREGGVEGKREGEEEDSLSLVCVFPACPPSNPEATRFHLHILSNMPLHWVGLWRIKTDLSSMNVWTEELDRRPGTCRYLYLWGPDPNLLLPLLLCIGPGCRLHCVSTNSFLWAQCCFYCLPWTNKQKSRMPGLCSRLLSEHCQKTKMLSRLSLLAHFILGPGCCGVASIHPLCDSLFQ